jgi:hypothetical protein
MLELSVANTQRNYLEFAYFGDKHSVDDLEGEEFSMLPNGFLDWPADGLPVN